MIGLKARPLFSSSFSPSFKLDIPIKASFQSTRARSSITMSTSSTPIQTIEHVVLVKVKDGVNSSQLHAMTNEVNNLISLDEVVHITAGPIIRSTSSSYNFTHMFHSRYNSKNDLSAYNVHPNHIHVVTEFVRPICEDVMAVDWITENLSDPRTLQSGTTIKLVFLKLKENLEQKAKNVILEAIREIKDEFPSIDQFTCGENFSERAKGFSIATMAIFKDLSEIEAQKFDEELVKLKKDKFKDYLESVMVIDYVVPSSTSLSS